MPMQHDERPFRIVAVRGAYRHLACRRAVLHPLVKLGDAQTKQWLQRAFDALRTMWKARLYRLWEANWDAFNRDKVNLSYMQNCPPFSVKTGTTARRCKRPLVCPFCYARQRVLEPYRKLEKVLYGDTTAYTGEDGHLLPLVRPDLKIVSFRLVTNGTHKVHLPLTTAEGMKTHVQRAQLIVNHGKRNEKDGFGAEYGAILHKVYPVPKETRLSVVRCGVLLVPHVPHERIEEYRANGGTVHVYEPSKKNLAEAVGRAFYFPKKMFWSDAHLYARMVEQMAGFHLSTWYGPHAPKTTFEE